ncbi:CopG family transcriptional regulator [Allobranchiibius huperziae]|uniref:Putative transcriptional regulator n=1 Tax=Allobranchiibius huperziae TaxID=1874116 RepID=A0A853DLT1_9MICO|nr:CopG family transcriptional regulator [Allobranchiibius huperziae]NYJ75590.1 putative transcriptional regulator [Allobranchiibius huperziae]
MAMTLRMTDELTEALRQTSEREGLSMQAVAVRAIEEYTSRHAHLRDQLLSTLVVEDRAVIARLADA